VSRRRRAGERSAITGHDADPDGVRALTEAGLKVKFV
jgi:hypothetical protein